MKLGCVQCMCRIWCRGPGAVGETHSHHVRHGVLARATDGQVCDRPLLGFHVDDHPARLPVKVGSAKPRDGCRCFAGEPSSWKLLM